MEHVVTKPTPPFRSQDGSLEVHQVPSWKDNLIWVAVCTQTGAAAIVDGPEAGSVLAYCEAHGITPTMILNTHTHPDHVGVNHDLQKRGRLDALTVVGPAGDAAKVPGIDRAVGEGDEVSIGAVRGRVMLTEGHMNGHVSYLFDDVLFCGDTMFGAGCGYLFDGPAAKMHASLERLAKLGDGVRVCCAHEYTEDDLRFAWSVEPDNEALAERIRQVWALRAEGGCTVPSTMGVERATNPFLRHHSQTLRKSVGEAMGEKLASPLDVFAATRALKDRKDYRERGDDVLPL